mmetsp:Transcript_3774/g.10254  ORF Transcript_3774/g.10254 Transcript_3774/m.10254 type:complete len:452 (+) Transcript_3774:23-1378(+)
MFELTRFAPLRYVCVLCQHQADVPGLQLALQPPVVQVVLQVAVADAEFEILQKLRVVHQVQAVEDVKVLLPGEDERVLHQPRQLRLARDVVVRVRRPQRAVPAAGLNHGRRERIEGDEICDFTRLVGILHHVGVNHPVAHAQVVLDLLLVEHRRDGELLEVFVQQHGHRRHVRVRHRPYSRRRRFVVQLEELDRSAHRHPLVEVGEPDLHQLLDVQGAVPVPRGADGLGEHHARGVRRLPDPAQVDPSRDLADEHGRESLRTQLLVDAQEVDLRQVQPFALYRQLRGHAGDERHELTGAHHPDAEVPVFHVPRGLEHPLEKLARVLEPEHGVVVLDVVVVEEVEDLVVHLLVRHVARAPLERGRQVVPVLLHLLHGHRVVDRSLRSGSIELGLELANRLGLPEGVVLHVVEGHARERSAGLLGEIRGRGAFMVLVRHDANEWAINEWACRR